MLGMLTGVVPSWDCTLSCFSPEVLPSLPCTHVRGVLGLEPAQGRGCGRSKCKARQSSFVLQSSRAPAQRGEPAIGEAAGRS